VRFGEGKIANDRPKIVMNENLYVAISSLASIVDQQIEER
jgi:hypothetical protein